MIRIRLDIDLPGDRLRLDWAPGVVADLDEPAELAQRALARAVADVQEWLQQRGAPTPAGDLEEPEDPERAAMHRELEHVDHVLREAGIEHLRGAAGVTALAEEAERLRYNITTDRMTCDISSGLRDVAPRLRADWSDHTANLLEEAADKLDSLITLLAQAERDRDAAKAKLDPLRTDRDASVRAMQGLSRDLLQARRERDDFSRRYNDVNNQLKTLNTRAHEGNQLLYEAWAVIANAGTHLGGWEAQHPEWVEAATRWRDRWHTWTDPNHGHVPFKDPVSHPEANCARCMGPNIVWTAPSPLWNEVMRGGDINGDERHAGIVCPTCFAVLAEKAGVADRWRLWPEMVHRPLQTITPSGRVWNPLTWQWDDNLCVDGHDSMGEAMRCTKTHFPIPIEAAAAAQDLLSGNPIARADARQLLAQLTGLSASDAATTSPSTETETEPYDAVPSEDR